MTSDSVPPRFHDGLQSAPHWIDVVVHEKYLYLYKGADVFAKYPYANIHVKNDWSDTNGGMFGFDDHPDAGLAINQKDMFIKIQSHLDVRKRASYRIPLYVPHLVIAGVLSVLALFVMWPALSRLSSLITHFVPASFEQRLGEEGIAEMKKEFPVCHDTAAQASLQKIVDYLAKATGDPAIRPEIYIFRTTEENAFTLPGNKMAVLGGFLSHAASENEVAGVLAHEVGHMVKHDSLEAFVEAEGINGLAMIMGGSGEYGNATRVAGFIQSLNYSRTKELAADDYGAHLLLRAGYSPSGLSSFLKRTQEEEKSEVIKALDKFDFLSTHPGTKERLQRIANIPTPSSYTSRLTEAEFQHLKVACALHKGAE